MSFHNKKPSKKDYVDATPFTIHCPHTTNKYNLTKDDAIAFSYSFWNKNWIRCITIDPGRANFAIRSEIRTYNYPTMEVPQFVEYPSVHPGLFEPTKVSKYEVMQSHNIKVEVEFFAVLDFDYDEKGDEICHIYSKMNEILDFYRKFYLESHIIVIERQIRENYRMVRLSQAIIQYFINVVKDTMYRPLIIEVDSKLKYSVLNGVKNTTKKGHRKSVWGPWMARNILNHYYDYTSIQTIDNLKNKKDDISDIVLQLEATLTKLKLLDKLPYMYADPGSQIPSNSQYQASYVPVNNQYQNPQNQPGLSDILSMNYLNHR